MKLIFLVSGILIIILCLGSLIKEMLLYKEIKERIDVLFSWLIDPLSGVIFLGIGLLLIITSIMYSF